MEPFTKKHLQLLDINNCDIQTRLNVVKLKGVAPGYDEYGLRPNSDTRTIEPARVRAADALQLEYQISDLVNEAYGLTPDEIDRMWKTAPPRMPISRNSNEHPVAAASSRRG